MKSEKLSEVFLVEKYTDDGVMLVSFATLKHKIIEYSYFLLEIGSVHDSKSYFSVSWISLFQSYFLNRIEWRKGFIEKNKCCNHQDEKA